MVSAKRTDIGLVSIVKNSFIADDDPPAVGGLDKSQTGQQSGFPCSGRTEQGGNFSGVQSQRHPVQCMNDSIAFSVSFAQIFSSQRDRFHESTSPALVRIALMIPATLAKMEIATTIPKRSHKSPVTSTTRRGK